MLRDRGNSFVISSVRFIEKHDLTNKRNNNQSVRFIEIWLIGVFCSFFFSFGVTLRFINSTDFVHSVHAVDGRPLCTVC